jgi:hypothetical protein
MESGKFIFGLDKDIQVTDSFIRRHDRIGLIPDAGDTGGKAQTMHEIIKSINGKRPAVFGWYAQVVAGTPFDGSQLFEVMDDLKASKAVFSPAIMPQGGWDGFKYNDNSQAVRMSVTIGLIRINGSR